MGIQIFNCFTCNARWLKKLKTGMVCTLIETDKGPVLIDTGPGLEDYHNPTLIFKTFKWVTTMPLDLQEAACNQVRKFGYQPDDIRHIVLTHMHFDHCGGLPDFPRATVHVHKREYQAFVGRLMRWTDLAYVRRHIAGVQKWEFYQEKGERWFDFDAIRLPFKPEMWLIPLHGHTRGHCGVAVKLRSGWFFNAGDAGAVYDDETPAWLIRFVLGPHDQQLRAFMRTHPEVLVSNSHMWPSFFEKSLE